MAIELHLEKMTDEEKLQAMEMLWEDLSKNPEKIVSPAWHEQALRETDARLAAGLETPIDWETAKKELRKRYE